MRVNNKKTIKENLDFELNIPVEEIPVDGYDDDEDLILAFDDIFFNPDEDEEDVEDVVVVTDTEDDIGDENVELEPLSLEGDLDTECAECPECAETTELCVCDEDCYIKVLKETYKLLFNLQTIHWNAIGTDFYCLHEELDDHIEYTRGIIDEIAEMSLEVKPSIQNPIDIIKTICDDCTLDMPTGFEKDEGFNAVKQCEDEFIKTLQDCYEEMPHDIQSTFDDWIRWYSVNANYKVRRQQMSKV